MRGKSSVARSVAVTDFCLHWGGHVTLRRKTGTGTFQRNRPHFSAAAFRWAIRGLVVFLLGSFFQTGTLQHKGNLKWPMWTMFGLNISIHKFMQHHQQEEIWAEFDLSKQNLKIPGASTHSKASRETKGEAKIRLQRESKITKTQNRPQTVGISQCPHRWMQSVSG